MERTWLAREIEDDRRYHPNLGGVTRGGLANHYPMTITALERLGASSDDAQQFVRSWRRHRAAIQDLGLVDRHVVTVDNWSEHLGHAELLPEFRRVFETLVAGDDGLDAVSEAVATMRDAVPMGLFHPIIRLSFAVDVGDRGAIADALAYMAIRHFDLFRAPELEVRAGSRSPAEVWRDLPESLVGLAEGLEGGSLRVCERLSAEPALHRAALPVDLSIPDICRLALRLYLNEPALTTLHAVTAAQALAHLTRVAGPSRAAQWQPIWTRYWIWLTGLYVEKGRPAALPVIDPDARDREWPALAAEARVSPEVHLIKMTYTCRWLDQTFGPDPLYRRAVVNMLEEGTAHPRRGAGLIRERL